MPQSNLVKVRCEVCGVYLGDREVDKVEGEYLELPCRECFAKNSPEASAPEALVQEWNILDHFLEQKRSEQLIHHPGQQPPRINVNIEYRSSIDTVLFITPRPMTQAALDRAKKQYYDFYTQLVRDMRSKPGDRKNQNAAEEIEKALAAIKANRVRNVTDQGMLNRPVSF